MARIRTIKPSFWEDEKIARLPRACRLFYIGMWNQADDMGVIRGNSALLKSAIFPYDEDLRVSEVQKWIDALVNARMLIPITYKSESYYIIRTFRSHQKFDAQIPEFHHTRGNKLQRNRQLRTPNGDPTGTHPSTRHGKGKGKWIGNIIPPIVPHRGKCVTI